MTLTRQQVRQAYIYACYQEIEALKPGNVHRFADGHRMTARQFLASAQVSAAPISNRALSVGERVLDAVKATSLKVGTNTNLGILLLCAPLAKTAEMPAGDLETGIKATLQNLGTDDARNIFAAIVHARPGGLGSVPEHDVNDAPDVSLLEAMGAAADRDMIARQYVTDFSDILDGGLRAHMAAMDCGEQGMWPTVFVYLHFLSNFVDSHIVRKHNVAIAEQTRNEAQQILDKVRVVQDGREREKLLLSFDARLKAANVNPGTSADLTVACLFAFKLNWLLHNGHVNA
ncbi:triphosphoribosyl-dephospho-CoA synthase [Phyllobacterium sp. K27]